MKKSKGNGGISLIVLVITIIVIIILASAVIVSLVNNNPITSASEARIKSDVSNMQGVFTNAVSKVMAESQDVIEITAGPLNTVTSGEKSAVGNAVYKLSDGTNGEVIFDTLPNEGLKYYTGKRLPIYNKKTTWYVDEDGIISLEVGDKKYGEGQIVKSIKIIASVIPSEEYIKTKATVKVEISSEEDIASIKFGGKEVEVPERKEGKYEVEIEVTENGTYEIEVSGVNGATNKAVVEVNEIDNLNEQIGIKETVTITEDYVKGNIGLEITYSKEIESIKINGESITVPNKVDGKYTVNKEVLENGEYKVEVKAKDGTINKVVVKVTQITEDMEIWNRADMESFRDKVNSGRTFLGKTVKLMDNINLEGNDSNQWVPIAKGAVYFEGTFDGNNKNISNIYINVSEGGQGLFAKMTGATIKNLTISSGKIQVGGTGNQWESGGIVGRAYNDSKIINCTNRASITQLGTTNMNIAGIVGTLFSNSTIDSCKNYGVVTANNNTYCVAGVVGANESGGNITSCENYGKIQANKCSSVGGVIGYLRSGSINKCVNNGEVESNNGNKYGNVAGICALLGEGINIDNSLNIANVTANSVEDGRAGGIVGTAKKTNIVSNCYNRGQISASGNIMVDAAGIVAHVDSRVVNINNCYSVATIIGTRKDAICAYGGNKSNCYSNSSVTSSLLGSNFKDDSNNINDGLPILTWQ